MLGASHAHGGGGHLGEAAGDRGRKGSAPRAFYTVLWETGLRPSTLWSLRAPEDYARGRRSLRIRAEADKNRFEREVPISDGAMEALDSVCPDIGLLFRRCDLRETLRRAGRSAGLPLLKANRLSNYDFRHARLTHLASNTQNLTGAAFLAGHKHVSTTALYVHPNEEAARDALRAVEVRAKDK